MKAHPQFGLLRHLELELILDDPYEVLAQHNNLHLSHHLPAFHDSHIVQLF